MLEEDYISAKDGGTVRLGALARRLLNSLLRYHQDFASLSSEANCSCKAVKSVRLTQLALGPDMVSTGRL